MPKNKIVQKNVYMRISEYCCFSFHYDTHYANISLHLLRH